jgi:S-adenosylmethionine synthetase
MSARILPAEYVFPGHPDKLCDAIADALVAEAIRREPRALVGVEVAIHRDQAVVTGRIGCRGADDINVDAIVRDVYQSAGYGDGWCPAPSELKVDNQLCLGLLEEGEADFRELSDDQAICVGYAVNYPQTNYLPVEHWLVYRLAQRLHRLRAEQPGLALGPDGKVIVFLKDEGASWALEGFSCSLQQREGDNGLSGKKLVVDAYGPRVPIGGGAWSGKDFFKADRAGGVHARRLAKLAVRLGLADEARVTLGWFPGDRAARILQILTDKGELSTSGALTEMIDLSLVHSGEKFSVPENLVELARWGHFTCGSPPWEKIKPY